MKRSSNRRHEHQISNRRNPRTATHRAVMSNTNGAITVHKARPATITMPAFRRRHSNRRRRIKSQQSIARSIHRHVPPRRTTFGRHRQNVPVVTTNNPVQTAASDDPPHLTVPLTNGDRCFFKPSLPVCTPRPRFILPYCPSSMNNLHKM